MHRLIVATFLVATMALPAHPHEPRIVEIAHIDDTIVCDAAQRAGGFLFVRVVRGTHLVLRWRSDEAVAVRLTGYNIEARIPAGGETLMRIEANVPGR